MSSAVNGAVRVRLLIWRCARWSGTPAVDNPTRARRQRLEKFLRRLLAGDAASFADSEESYLPMQKREKMRSSRSLV